MNEKEALAIIKKDACDRWGTYSVEYCEAGAYLEAIEKAKVLEEALETLKRFPISDFIGEYHPEINRALTQWEKEK